MNNHKQWKLLLLILLVCLAGCAFVGSPHSHAGSTPGFLLGIWHGLLAPWTLIIRFFLKIQMYAVPNSGWTYDLGFLLGIAASIPIGWMAAIVALVAHFLVL